MLPAIALALVLVTGDSTRVPPPVTAPTVAPADSAAADTSAWSVPFDFNFSSVDFSALGDVLSKESLWEDMSPWGVELGVSTGGGSGESVGVLRPRDGEPPFLPLGFTRPWAMSLGVQYHVARHALIGLSYSQNSIDYGWDDLSTGDSYSVGKAIVGTWRADLLWGSDPFDPAHDDPWGWWIGPTVAIAQPRSIRPNPNQADSVFVDQISRHTAVSYGLLIRGEAGWIALFVGADLTLWVRNAATLLDFHTAPTAAYEGDRGEHWPPLLRFRLGTRFF